MRKLSTVCSVAVFVASALISLDTQAAPTISNPVPLDGALVQDSVFVRVTVNSPFAITSVVATIDGVAHPLPFFSVKEWEANVNLTSASYGLIPLVVTVTDANGDTTSYSATLKHDKAPTITVLTPDFSVGSPTVRLHATCADSDAYGCASITASGPGPAITTMTSELDQVIDVSSYGGKGNTVVTFTAKDAAGLSATKSIVVYGPLSPLQPGAVDAVLGGIIDANENSILFVGSNQVQAKNRSTGAVTSFGPASSGITNGHLSSTGAIWTGGDSANGTYTARPANTNFRAKGDWATWSTSAALFRQNLATGAVSTVVSTDTLYGLADVDAAGSIVWSQATGGFVVYQQNAAGVTSLVNPASKTDVLPVVDGANVVYTTHSLTGDRRPIYLRTGGTSTALEPNVTTTMTAPGPYTNYLANAGWVAFDENVGGTLTLWTRAPDGTTALASPHTGIKSIQSINSLGEVIYTTAAGTYLCSAGAAGPTPTVSIPSTYGRLRSVGTDWYSFRGGSLYVYDRASLSGGVDGGAGDGGADGGDPDAGDVDAGNVDGGIDASAAGDVDGGASSGSSSSSGGASSSGGSSSSSGGSSGGSSSSSGGSDGDGGDGPAIDDGGCAIAYGSPRGLSAGALALLASAALLRARRRTRK